MTMIVRMLRLAGALLAVFAGCRALAADLEVETWLTLGDQTSKLARQPDLTFVPGGGTSAVRIGMDTTTTYQRMEGFGASLTDSSAWLIENMLSPQQRDAWLRGLFSDKEGIGISYVRQPMGASDFATSWYTYDDMPPGETDPGLEHFSVAHDDAYIVPNLQRAMAINPQLKVMGSPWSAPAWMKTSGQLNGGSLSPEYYDAYAEYFVRYVQEYEARGIPIHAITVQNEPHHSSSGMPTMWMDASQQATLIKDYLGPAFAREGIDTKIVIWDHNWDDTSFALSIFNDAEANPYVAGSAWHAYAGDPSAQSVVHNAFPDKEIYFTEITGGDWGTVWADNLVWGLHKVMIGATRNWAQTVTYWNLALDTNHGPHTGGCSTCRGVTTVDPATGEFQFNEEYYVVGHASKFVDPGAYRIGSSYFDGNIETVAFLNPDGSEVLIALNPTNSWKDFDVLREGEYFSTMLPPESVATFKLWPTLEWDGLGDGRWDEIDGGTGNSRWRDHAGNPVSVFPGGGTHAVVKGDTITVAADRSSHAVSVDSGRLVIEPTGSLAVSSDVNVAPGAALDVAGTLDADVLSTAGTNTVAGGASISVGGRLTLDSRLDTTGATLATVAGVTGIHVNPGGDLTTGNQLLGDQLNVAGSVHAAGLDVARLNVTGGGSLSASAAVAAQSVTISGGTVHLNEGAPLAADHVNIFDGAVNLGADAEVHSLAVSGGTVNPGAHRFIVGSQMRLGNTKFAIDGDHEFAVEAAGGTDLLTRSNVTLSGGRLTVSMSHADILADAAGVWTFDNMVGDTVVNEGTVGVSADGRVVGGATIVPRGLGGAVSLDGVSGQVVIPDHPAFEFPPEQSFTLSLWYRHDQPNTENNGLITKGYNAPGRADNFYLLQINESDQAQLHSRPTSGWTPQVLFGNPTDIIDDAWHQVTLVRDSQANELRLYVDGGPPAVYAMGTGDANGDWRMGVNDSPLVIGNHYGRFTPGMFDDVVVFRRALDGSEVAALWADGSGIGPVDPVAVPNTSFLVTADTELHLESQGPAVLGDLTVRPGVNLAVTSEAPTGPILQNQATVTADGAVILAGGTGTMFNGSGGTVGGSGRIEGNVVGGAGSFIAPGHSTGELVVTGDYQWQGGHTYRFDIDDPGGTPGAGWDLLTVGGSLDLDPAGQLLIDVTTTNPAVPDTEFTLPLADAGQTLAGFHSDLFQVAGPQFDGTFSVLLGSDAGGDASQLFLDYAPPHPSLTLDVDASGQADALTDGVLILRHLFGFTGDALVADALDPNAVRIDPDDIAAYLEAGESSMLDVDASGEADALTDGILIFRYLFGFTDDALVADALDPVATRTSPDDILAFLDAYQPGVQTPLNISLHGFAAAPLARDYPTSTAAAVPEPPAAVLAALGLAALLLLRRVLC